MARRIGFIIAVCLKCLLSFSFILASIDSDATLPRFYFTEEPGGTVYGSRGDDICFNCSAVCVESGAVKMTWRKDDRVVSNTTRRYVHLNGTLCIERLRRPSDEGIYECLATHPLGTIVSPKMKLVLTRIESVSIDPVDVSVVEGESVRFQCVVTGSLPPFTISWEHNGRMISTDDVHRVTVLDQLGVLQMVRVTAKDAGQYRCVVLNQTSSTATLRVAPATVGQQVAVALLSGPKDEVVVHMQTLVLECFLTGLPVPQVTWTKQGSTLGKHVHQYGSGNLMIMDVEVSDAGVYICSWLGRSGPDNDHISRAHANVTLSFPPQFVPANSILPFTLRRREQIVRLFCDFDGRPLPQVTWLKNGQRLEHNWRIKIDKGELSISQIWPSDAGMYQCRAENTAGTDEATTLLKFEVNDNAPPPPVALVANANKTWIHLSWRNPPRNKGLSISSREYNISAYCVSISLSKDDHEVQHVVERVGQQPGGSFNLTNLRPYTNYSLYVVAYNSYGASVPSRRLSVTTLEDVPLSFPLLQVVPLNASSIRLSWKEISAEQARGIVTEYKILYRKHGTEAYQKVPLQPTRTEYVLKGLEPNTKYDIMASARTSAGYPSDETSLLPWISCLTRGYNQSDGGSLICRVGHGTYFSVPSRPIP